MTCDFRLSYGRTLASKAYKVAVNRDATDLNLNADITPRSLSVQSDVQRFLIALADRCEEELDRGSELDPVKKAKSTTLAQGRAALRADWISTLRKRDAGANRPPFLSQPPYHETRQRLSAKTGSGKTSGKLTKRAVYYCSARDAENQAKAEKPADRFLNPMLVAEQLGAKTSFLRRFMLQNPKICQDRLRTWETHVERRCFRRYTCQARLDYRR